MLEVNQISVNYGAAPALWDVSINCGDKELVCVVGPNGAGKTTLINAIAGVHGVKSGTLVYGGRDITRLASHRYCEAGIAIVPEGRRLFTQMSVLENLELGSFLPAAKARRAERLESVLALFPVLKVKLHSMAGSLSGGQQQMVAIGRALMSNPRVLLCDELSLGLAPVVIKEIYAAFPQIKESGTSIIVVEQDIGQALRVADHVHCMMEGRITLSGRPADLSREAIRDAYFGVSHA